MKIIYLKVEIDICRQFYFDNKSAISKVYNMIRHDRTKHIEINMHRIKDNLDIDLVVTTHVGF